jgi:uncharacterized damage-inducible protein DinB
MMRLLLLAASVLYAQQERTVSMRMVDESAGGGATALAGQKYKVHYTGTFPDGKKFDSSRDRNEPFEFVQGRRLVIAGWEMGFEGMKVGGKRKLYIPYQLAYGEKGSGTTIPPRADLVFDIELLGVEDAPVIPAAHEFLAVTLDQQAKLEKIAAAIPDDKWDWRPNEKVRGVAEVYQNFIQSLDMGVETALGRKPMAGIALASADKATTLANLKAAADAARKKIEPLRPGALAREVDLFGKQTPARTVLAQTAAHGGEHIGQLIVYLRLLGLTPP